MDVLIDKEGFKLVRFPCDCFLPEHSVDLIIEKDADITIITLEIKGDKEYLLSRIKLAWRMLLGRRVLLSEVVLNDKNAQALSEILKVGG